MTHVFDSGYSLPQRRKIREAIVAQLRRDMPMASMPGSTGHLYIAAIIELPAPFVESDSDLEEMLKEAVSGRSPILAVALGPRSFEPIGTDALAWRSELSVHVYVMSSNQRGLLERLRGGDATSQTNDAADPGLETAMEHTLERLAGFTPPDCGASELRVSREDFIVVGDEFTAAELTFEMQVETYVNPNRGLTQLATEIDTTHADTEAGDPSDRETLTELPP